MESTVMEKSRGLGIG